MLVGVMSDSHDNIYAVDKAINKFLENSVDLIIHLGDIISPFAVRRINKLINDKKLIAVLGNNDGDVFLLSKLFNEYGWTLYSGPSVINLNNKKLLIFHGYDGIEHTVRLAEAFAKTLDVDAVLFGHTHRVYNRKIEGKLILNPGETCGYLTGKSTIALLDTDSLEARVIEL